MKYLAIIALALALTCTILVGMLRQKAKENRVLINNNKSLSMGLKSYKTRSDQTATKVIEQQITYRNLEDSLGAIIKDLKIKPRHVAKIGVVATKIDTVVSAPVVVSEKQDTCYHFSINSEFTVRACIKNDTATLHTEIGNRQSIIFSTEKHFINKRSRIFIVRWLQRKQRVVTATVVNSNAAIRVEEQSFKHIIN